MCRTWAILPVKAFDRAKSRLSSVLTGAQCASLARLMATDVLRALVNTPGVDRVLVLGQGAEQAALAREFDCDYVNDDPSLDMSANLTRIAQLPEIQSTRTLLVIPADLPRICPQDLARVLRGHEKGVTICRAARDGGTNALIATLPQRVTFRFGMDSANRHALAAHATGLPVSLLDDTAFERDMDTPEDLQWLCCQNISSDTERFLHESGLATQLDDMIAAAATA